MSKKEKPEEPLVLIKRSILQAEGSILKSNIITYLCNKINECMNWYRLCPLDADGIPIHVGDTLVRPHDGGPRVVNKIVYDSNGVHVYIGGIPLDHTSFRHVPEPTVESALGQMHNELLHVWQSDMDNALRQDKIEEIIGKYSEKFELADHS